MGLYKVLTDRFIGFTYALCVEYTFCIGVSVLYVLFVSGYIDCWRVHMFCIDFVCVL